ncbi:endonuclease domain-containing protein [Streptomyces mobaraensis]|uniref:Recombination endonuclease VII n=1 Tax=Streptomyces mobaraensis TaxID=35621 RepID=A0A5N5WCV6_STRMB|nr:endonuclease domain-containing protein [Streptomyces mobaraensis]KAB7850161.1 hypothetical protein FRZ00_06070 [Streptomyces mobaraensis]
MTAAAQAGRRLHGKGHAPEGKKCHHLHEYGLDCWEYEELRTRANECCEICGVGEGAVYKQLLHIDHCHETGRPRGLLCPKCNAVMACYDGRKRWGANRRWEEKAALYVALFRMWRAYGRATARMGTTQVDDMIDHIRATIRKHGNQQDLTDLAAGEQELAARRARKGGRPPRRVS